MADIPGATASTYTPTSADIGQQLTVQVTATNAAGNATATSAPTAAVTSGGGGGGTTGWQVLPLGGAGAIMKVSVHADGTRGCHLDSGGGYKWNSATGRWEQFMTSLSLPTADAVIGSLMGVYYLAIAPSNSSRWWMFYSGYIFRSDDKGATWTNTTRSSAFPQTVHWYDEANQGQRGDGPKLSIDPSDPDKVLVATSVNGSNGAYYTLNGGTTWVALAGVPASTGTDHTPATGMLCSFGATSSTAYIWSYGNGLYKTTTGLNGTWSLVASSPAIRVTALHVAADGKVFLASNSVVQRVHMLSGTTWTTGTTTGATGYFLNAIASNPANSAQIWVVGNNGDVSYSSDHGVTWVGSPNNFTLTSADIPWFTTRNGGTTGELYPVGMVYDPSTGELWSGFGLGVIRVAAPTTNARVDWQSVTAGIEECIGARIVKPAGGRPLMAIWDQGVFYSPDATTFPPIKGGVDPVFCPAWSLAVCPTNPLVVAARLFQQGVEKSGKTVTGGVNGYNSWTPFNMSAVSPDHSGGQIAIGSDPLNMVMTMADYIGDTCPPYRTVDGGATWTPITISGVSSVSPCGWQGNDYELRHTLCADWVQPNTFYMYNNGASGGTTSAAGVYRSTDKGATWTNVHAGVFPGITVINARMMCVPGQDGHLFYTCGGITSTHNKPSPQRSTDHAATWSVVSTLGETWSIGFGKAQSGGYPAIFAIGYDASNTTFGIRRSDDNAATWALLPGSTNILNSIDALRDVCGDPDVWGDCYVATAATGFYYYKA